MHAKLQPISNWSAKRYICSSRPSSIVCAIATSRECFTFRECIAFFKLPVISIVNGFKKFLVDWKLNSAVARPSNTLRGTFSMVWCYVLLFPQLQGVKDRAIAWLVHLLVLGRAVKQVFSWSFCLDFRSGLDCLGDMTSRKCFLHPKIYIKNQQPLWWTRSHCRSANILVALYFINIYRKNGTHLIRWFSFCHLQAAKLREAVFNGQKVWASFVDHKWPPLANCHINNISLYPFKWPVGAYRAWWGE